MPAKRILRRVVRANSPGQAIRAISRAIGFKVAQIARDEGIGRSYTDEALNAELDKFIWYPDYANMR